MNRITLNFLDLENFQNYSTNDLERKLFGELQTINSIIKIIHDMYLVIFVQKIQNLVL